MSLELHDLRERTLANNLVWLRGFGCSVEREGDIIYVDNQESRDYRALLLFAGPEESYAAFRKLVGEVRTSFLRPNVYVDKKADAIRLKQLLTLQGYVKTSVSYVTAGEVSGGDKAATDVSIRAVEPTEMVEWASVYSLGFGRVGKEATLDRNRWRLASEREEVRHWFFIKRNEVVGICQTCHAHGVVGVYSFTLIPSGREVGLIHGAIQTLRAKLAERGRVTAYFERVKEGDRKPFLARSAKLFTGFKVIRVSAGYRRAGGAQAAVRVVNKT